MRCSFVLLMGLAACASTPQPATAQANATWRAGPSIASPRDHHATFVATTSSGHSFLFVIGGNDYKSFLADAHAAPIATDGSLGAFAPTTPLPEARAGGGVISFGTHVALLGGKDGRGTHADVFLSDVRENGELAPWRAGAPLPSPRFHLVSVATASAVYVTGGLGATGAVATVFRGTLRPDGAIDAWTEVTPMPGPRSHHSSFVHAGWLYVVGGLSGDPLNDDDKPVSDVARARIAADGELGPWSVVATLDRPRMTHANAVHGGHLYVLGGIEENGPSAGVARAPLGADGALGAWSVSSALPHARAHMHQCPMWNGTIYAVGGSRVHGEVTADVSIGSLR